MMAFVLVFLLSGCGLGDCREFCAVEADCVEDELQAYDATWRAWTGFDDRDAFEEACFGEFADSRDEGGERDDLNAVCREELRRPCGG